jgi:hypothetical protein
MSFSKSHTRHVITVSLYLKTTLATAASVATPMETYYPLLDITGRDIVDTPTSTTTNEAAKPTSTDATTIVVDEDATWEFEYLKAMAEAVRSFTIELVLLCANRSLGGDEEGVHVGQEKEMRQWGWHARQEVR